jgi:hypothetical protein
VSNAPWNRSIIQSRIDTIISISISLRGPPRSSPKRTKATRPVGIFAQKETVNLALQDEIGIVIPKESNAIRNPVALQQVFRTHQPVTQHFEKAGLTNFRRRLKVLSKGADRALMHFEEHPVLAAKVLKNGAFGNAKREGDVTDSDRMMTTLGKMLRGSVDDAAALRLRPGTSESLALVMVRCTTVAGDSWHGE